jgi:hypothetical protein
MWIRDQQSSWATNIIALFFTVLTSAGFRIRALRRRSPFFVVGLIRCHHPFHVIDVALGSPTGFPPYQINGLISNCASFDGNVHGDRSFRDALSFEYQRLTKECRASTEDEGSQSILCPLRGPRAVVSTVGNFPTDLIGQ